MHIFHVIMKTIVVVLVFAVGAFFLARGLGVAIPVIEYKGLKANNLPAGAGILLFDLALAVLWKPKVTETVTETLADGTKRVFEKTISFINKP